MVDKEIEKVKWLIKLEDKKHKNRLKEIEVERKARLDVENTKFEHIMSSYRLKRADGRY